MTSSEGDDCPFCAIVGDRSKLTTELVRDWPDALAIVPLDPVVMGHVIVFPKIHVPHFAAAPGVTAAVTLRAAQLAGDWMSGPDEGIDVSANLIASWGAPATATIEHLHFHLVPRRAGDGLLLPWSNQTADAQN